MSMLTMLLDSPLMDEVQFVKQNFAFCIIKTQFVNKVFNNKCFRLRIRRKPHIAKIRPSLICSNLLSRVQRTVNRLHTLTKDNYAINTTQIHSYLWTETAQTMTKMTKFGGD